MDISNVHHKLLYHWQATVQSSTIQKLKKMFTNLICCSLFSSSAVMLKNAGGRSTCFAACEGSSTWRLRSSSREMGSALCNASHKIWKTGKHHNTLTPSSLVGGWQHFTGSTGSIFRANIYLLTPWCRVLLEKLTGLQLVKKFPAFHGTRRFITVLTSVRHLSLSRANPIQSTYPHPTSWRSILMLSTHLCLGLPSGLFTSGFPTKTLYAPLSSPIRTTCASPSHSSRIYHPHNIGWGVQIT